LLGAIAFVFIVSAVIAAISMVLQSGKTEAMTPSQRAESGYAATHGQVNRELVCPHCQNKGKVHTKTVAAKKGLSGGKATTAILTGGVSLASGLSRKENLTRASCRNCSSTWHF
jgi:hypothetical protein